MDLVIGTFNLNNLFDRFNFEANITSLPAEGRTATTTFEWMFAHEDCRIGDEPPMEGTVVSPESGGVVRIQRNPDGRLIQAKSTKEQDALAQRIDAMVADHGLGVLALQEVENLDALRRFNRDKLARPFGWEVLLEGNDSRFIDVALLSHFPVANLTSHRYETHPDDPDPIFGRDMLEVDILRPNGRRLMKVFVNHLKSKFVPFDSDDPEAAAAAGTLRRTRQAETAVRIIDRSTRPRERFVMLGDMNDAPDSAPLTSFAASGMTDALTNVVESQPPPPSRNPEDVPPTVRWTSRFSQSNAPDSFDLLDQIWTSPSLDDHLDHAQIERRPKWTKTAAGVGSDHDPAWIRLTGL